jgi:hypothetical protein
MKQLLCKVIGHREFDPEVLADRPWENRDFRGFSPAEFREPHCLRCGEDLITGDR